MSLRFSSIKLITFDAKDTIIKLKKSAGTFYGETAQLYGVQVDNSHFDSLDRTFKCCFAEVSKEHPNYGQETGISLVEWWSLVIHKGFRKANFDESTLPSSTLTQISSHAYKLFATSNCWDVKDDAVSALSQIRSKRPDIKLGVISNGDDRLDSLLMQLGLRHFFDFTLDSYSAKCEKPSKEIFDLALRGAGVSSADAALHVGDDLETDYFASKRAGWSSSLLLVSDATKESFRGKVQDESDLITSLSQIVPQL